jgi:PQQ-dependent catabolism-associated CXXCW motif protein
MILRRIAVWFAAAALAHAAAADTVPEPDGYRMEAFRAPVPETLTGAEVVDTAEAEMLWRAGDTVFVDVMPRPVRPENLPEGTVWRDKPRDSIPGALWLANVGYGALHPDMDARFRATLAEATGGDRARPLLFFCLMDCWMSWNAAKRALEEYGYARVFWYPDGTDGWAFADLPLKRTSPAPGF